MMRYSVLLLIVMSCAGFCFSQEKLLLEPTNDDENHWNPSFSPDGSQIVYARQVDGKYQLYIVNVDDQTSRRLTEGDYNSWRPKWSPDGGHIAFSADKTGQYEIYTLSVDGSNMEQFTEGEGSKERMSWSPDSKMLVYDSNESGNWDIYTLNLSTGKKTRLTENPGFDGYPDWSEDGKWIAFNSDLHQPDGKATSREIYIMTASGKNVKRLTENDQFDQAPDWSPDGTWISYFGDLEIKKVNINTLEVVQLTHNEEWDFMPQWSHDGKTIAFDSRRDGRRGIYLMNSDGSNQRKITNKELGHFARIVKQEGAKAGIAAYKYSKKENPDKFYYLDAELYSLVYDYAQKGEMNDALALLNFHLKNSGYDASAFEKTGDYLVKFQFPEMARTFYNEALIKSPNERLVQKIQNLAGN